MDAAEVGDGLAFLASLLDASSADGCMEEPAVDGAGVAAAVDEVDAVAEALSGLTPSFFSADRSDCEQCITQPGASSDEFQTPAK